MARPNDGAFVGRTSDLALLKNILNSAAQGHGAAVFIVGEGGIGKTRLASAAADYARTSGWEVATGRAYPVETGVPYAVFADALLPFIQKIDASKLTVLTRGASADLAQLFPNLPATNGHERARTGADPTEIKSRLLWNFTQFLNRVSARQPLLLVLDNLQWSDESSLELFHFVARQIEKQKIVLIGTYNTAERDANAKLKTTEQSLLRLNALQVHRLEPLTCPDIEEFIESTYGVEKGSHAQFSSLLYDWTRGNPFFIEETLKSLTESGALRHKDGRWTGFEMESLQVPPTVRDVVSARFDRLSADARLVADLAAVIGTRVRYETLSRIAGLAETQIVEAIDELLSARVLAESGNIDAIQYDFTHPLLQQVLYNELGQARARLLHGTIARELETLYREQATSHADELAFHYSRGHSTALAAKAVRYLTLAGRRALAKYANREAANYLAAALEQLETTDIDEAQREELLISLARARQRLGEYDEALELWRRARGAMEKREDPGRIAEIELRMGLACYWSARYPDALTHFKTGLSTIGDAADPATSVRLRLSLGICLQDLGRLDEARTEFEKALSTAEANGVNNDALLSRAHRALLLLHTWTGPLDVARAHGLQAIAYAEAAGERMLEWTAHWGMALQGGVAGDAAEFVKHLEATERLADQMHSPLLPLWSAELSVQYLSSIGEWDSALDKAERTIVAARSLNQRMLLPRLYVWSGLILLWRGDQTKSKEYFDLAWKLAGVERIGSLEADGDRTLDVPSIVPAHLGLASYYLARGRPHETVRIGEAGLAIADSTGYVVWALQWLLPTVGEAALVARDFERADRHLARMRRDATRVQHKLGLAYADACDGLLALHRDGDKEKGIELLQAAVEKLDSIPFPPQAARVRRQLAGALIEVARRDEGMRELRKSHDTFARLGAKPELDATRIELRELGVRPPPRSSVPGAAGLTGREVEIARMVAGRKSNKEIGAALDISSRTVSTHLSNIFMKLNVSSRGELTDFVRQNGLTET